MKEDKLQAKVVMEFSQKYVEYDDCIFEVNNNPKNKAHAMYRKSMGMKSGVSDLVMMVPNYGEFAGIELKSDDYHKKDQVAKELRWGKTIIELGGYYFISSSFEDVMYWIECLINKRTDIVIEMQNNAIAWVDEKMKDELKSISF